MQEKISEIVDLLIQEISQQNDPVRFQWDEVSEKLLKKGYSEPEILKAVEWVLMNINRPAFRKYQSSVRRRRPHAFRALIAEERLFFTPDGYGYLIQLQTLGLMGPIQVEQVIERAFMLGLARVELLELKGIVRHVLLETVPETTGTNTIFQPGNDKIN